MEMRNVLLSSAILGAAFGLGAETTTTAHASHVIYQAPSVKVSHAKHHSKARHTRRQSGVKTSHHRYNGVSANGVITDLSKVNAKSSSNVSTSSSNHNTAYDWTNSVTEAGQSPWETSNTGAAAHQVLHNGNEIYYYNGATGSDYDVVNQAIQAWNSLGVIKLVEVNQSLAEIQISNDNYSGDDGHSIYGVTPYYTTSDGTMSQAHSYLCRASDHVSFQQKVAIATHEIGHSLGFAHDQSKYYGPNGQYSNHIMYSGQTDKTLPVSTKEANALREHYGL